MGGGLTFPVHNDLASTATLHVNCFLPASLPEHFSDSIIIFLSFPFSFCYLSSLFDPMVCDLLSFPTSLFVGVYLSPSSPSVLIHLSIIYIYLSCVPFTHSFPLPRLGIPADLKPRGDASEGVFLLRVSSPRHLEKKSSQGRLLIALREMRGERKTLPRFPSSRQPRLVDFCHFVIRRKSCRIIFRCLNKQAKSEFK